MVWGPFRNNFSNCYIMFFEAAFAAGWKEQSVFTDPYSNAKKTIGWFSAVHAF